MTHDYEGQEIDSVCDLMITPISEMKITITA